MEVDLQQLRTNIEQELQELERRKSVLREQMEHIDTVERMARGTLEPGDRRDKMVGLVKYKSEVEATGSESRSWFRR